MDKISQARDLHEVLVQFGLEMAKMCAQKHIGELTMNATVGDDGQKSTQSIIVPLDAMLCLEKSTSSFLEFLEQLEKAN